METFIPLYKPYIGEEERENLISAYDSTWISSAGKFLSKFENEFAQLIDVPHVTAVTNGTVAIHLALHALDLKPGDEVIVPTLTFIASVNPIVQAGGTPIFADVREEDWQIDPEDVRQKISPRTKAILVVHLYGMACDLDEIMKISSQYGIPVIEDCAEAVGVEWDGKHVGSYGLISTWSFFGNKTITTGEGGGVATSDEKLFEKVLLAKGQGQDLNRRYWHPVPGFNYRMTNLCAAIGLGQLSKVDEILAKKRAIGEQYISELSGSGVVFQHMNEKVQPSYWLNTVLLPDGIDRDSVIVSLQRLGIETRPMFYCAHTMPMYRSMGAHCPTAENLSGRGISLPSYPSLSPREVKRVSERLLEIVGI